MNGRRVFYFGNRLAGKKVAIYGGGTTGETIYAQLTQSGHDVVAVIDQMAKQTERKFACPLVTFEEFVKSFQYDYIIIASSSPAVQNEIAQHIIRQGIVGEKIYIPENGYSVNNCIYTIIDNPQKAWQQLLEIRNVCMRDSGSIVELWFWMIEYYEKLTDKEQYKRIIKNIADTTEDRMLRIMCIQYLIVLKGATSEDMKALVEDSIQMADDNPEWGYMLAEFIPHYEQLDYTLVYEGMGRDRKLLWKKLSDYFIDSSALNVEYKSSHNKNKIVFLAPILSDKNNSPSMYMRFVASTLEKYANADIMLLVMPYAQRRCFDFMSNYDEGYWRSTKPHIEYNRRVISDRIRIEYIVEDDLHNMFRKALEVIDDYNPYYIIDFLDDYCPLSNVLVNKYPVLAWPFRTCTLGVDFTKTFMSVTDFNREEIGDKWLDLEGIRISTPAEHIYNKSERLNIPESSFVIVTVGYRLKDELKSSLLKEMKRLLDTYHDMYWMLVGDTSAESILEYSGIPMDQVVMMSYEDDLPALYRICDVYLNPDRNGGGFSILFAMENDVIIAALRKNLDYGACWVGEEQLIIGGAKEQCDFIENLYLDKNFRQEKKEALKRRMEEMYSPERWERQFSAAMNKMADEFYDIRNC